MNEKKYLNWFNKIGYGSGDVAGNVVYAFLSTFMMFYLRILSVWTSVLWVR